MRFQRDEARDERDRQLDRAIAEAKRELVRQVEDAKGRREPKDSRHLRKQR